MAKINQIPGEVTVKQAIKDFFRGYFDFKGRTTRAGYWWIIIILLILRILSQLITYSQKPLYYSLHIQVLQHSNYINPFVLIALLVDILLLLAEILIIIPKISLTVRRMIDLGLSQKLSITLTIFISIFTFVISFLCIHYLHYNPLAIILIQQLLQLPIYIITIKKTNHYVSRS